MFVSHDAREGAAALLVFPPNSMSMGGQLRPVAQLEQRLQALQQGGHGRSAKMQLLEKENLQMH